MSLLCPLLRPALPILVLSRVPAWNMLWLCGTGQACSAAPYASAPPSIVCCVDALSLEAGCLFTQYPAPCWLVYSRLSSVNQHSWQHPGESIGLWLVWSCKQGQGGQWGVMDDGTGAGECMAGRECLRVGSGSTLFISVWIKALAPFETQGGGCQQKGPPVKP